MSEKVKDIVRKEMSLSMSIDLDLNCNRNLERTNDYEDQIISLTKFSLKVIFLLIESDYWYLVFLRFSKFQCYIDETIQVTSEAMCIKSRTFKNDNVWVLVHNDKYKTRSKIDIRMQVKKPISTNKNIDLYDNEAMTDFELRADDGSVRFHRVVLALSSPVLKTMLTGKWKETAQGHVEVPGISKNTIQQFKDYIYKSFVPDNVSLDLLSLASYYMMTELEEICMEKIAGNLTSENVWSVLEYCGSHKLTKLWTAIINRQAENNVIFKAQKRESKYLNPLDF